MYPIFVKNESFCKNSSVFSSFFAETLAGKKKSRIFAPHLRNQGTCPDGGIGRRAGLKHQWIHFHPGSTPGLGTNKQRGFKVQA